MTLPQRLARYLSVWARFHQIRELDLNRQSLEEVVDVVLQFAGGFFEPIQIRSELVEALRENRKLRPKYVVEGGTAGGGTPVLWARGADPEAALGAIDLPGRGVGGGPSDLA